jgi:hypothetical protein
VQRTPREAAASGQRREPRQYAAHAVVEMKGRSPVPEHGDPNVKTISLALEPEEWRKLRVWAAEEGTSVRAILVRIVRRVLEDRPRTGF